MIKQLVNSISKFRKFNPHKNIIIAGSCRSGTTWLAEILSKLYFGHVVFEPLRETHHSQFQKIRLKTRQYVPEEKNWPELEHTFNCLFNGKMISIDNLLKFDIFKLVFSKRQIIKFCHANLLLPWLIKHYPGLKPIYIVRHPASVILSQKKHKDLMDGLTVETEKEQLKKNSLFKKQHIPLLESINSKTEALTFRWCVENVYLLEHENNEKWLTVSYEDLVQNSPTQIDRIAKWIGLPIKESRKNKNLLKPSSRASKDLHQDIRKQLDKWKLALTESEKAEIFKICNSFGINIYDNYLKLSK